MALNHAEKFMLGMIVSRLADLKKEDELADFVETRQPFGQDRNFMGNQEKIECVSVHHLYQMYPDYTLTKKLIEFTQLVLNYVYEPVVFMPTHSRVMYSTHDEKFNLKMSLLEQNGLKFDYYDENVFRYYHNEQQREQMQKDQATAFAIKFGDYYVDFNVYIPQVEVKGIGENVYGHATYLHIQEHMGDAHGGSHRPMRVSREERVESYERQIINQFANWATNQALNFIRHSRHLRRQNKSLKDLAIQVEVRSSYVPEPEQKEEPQPKAAGQTNNCQPPL